MVGSWSVHALVVGSCYSKPENTEVLTQVEGNRSNYPVHKNTEVLSIKISIYRRVGNLKTKTNKKP